MWGTVYSVVAAVSFLNVLLIHDKSTYSTPIAILALVAYLMGTASHHADRDKLTEQRVQLAAEREVFASECARTQRDLEVQERRGTEALAAERARMLAEMEEQRDAMLAELGAHKAEYEREAFRVGWEMCAAGVAEEDGSAWAKVVALPIPAPAQGTIGSDILSN